jgi:two-component system chemotaxis response regulator CheY
METSTSSANSVAAESISASNRLRHRSVVCGEHATRRSFLRTVNDDLVEATAAARLGVALVVCECDREDCSESLPVDFADYEAVRIHPARFLVAPGHEDGQRVLAKNGRAALIEVGPNSQALGDDGDSDAVGNGPVRRVLVVDDDESIRMICSINLEAAGLSVLEASDGCEGLERARSERPDLVLTDVVMPRLDGFGLAEALQRYDRTREIPVVFMTGCFEESYETRARELGAFAILHKPFTPETLTSVALRAVV